MIELYLLGVINKLFVLSSCAFASVFFVNLHLFAEVRDVRKIGGGRELRGGAAKKVDGVFPGWPQSFRHQRRSVGDYSLGRGEIAQDSGTKGGSLHGELDHCRESQGWATTCSRVCLNVTGRTKE